MTSTPKSATTDPVQPTQTLDQAVLSSLTEEGTDCIKVLDLDARLLSMNAGGQRAMEIDDFEVCRFLLWLDFWAGEDRLRVEAALDRARAGQRSTFEGQAATFKGTPRWWEVRVSPLLNTSGAVHQLLVISRDITARKQAELALSELNADLERQVAERVRQALQDGQAQQAFMAFTEAVGTQTDVKALARHAVQLLQDRFADASVGFYVRDGDLWTAQVWSDDLPPEVVAVITAGVSSDHPILAEVLRTRQAVLKNADAHGSLEASATYQAVGSVPLTLGGEVCGLLSVGLRQTPAWPEQDWQLVQALARGLNLALERSAQVRRLEESAQAQQVFLAFTEAVGVQTDVLVLAKQAIGVLGAHLPGSTASYLRPEDGLWKAHAWNPGLPDPVIALITAGLPGNHPLIEQLVQTHQPVFVDHWTPLPEQEAAAPELNRTVAAYPLLLGNSVCGLLSVGLKQARPWRHQDRALIRAVGRALNLALERAENLRQLTERGLELEMLNREVQRERTFLQAVLQSMSEGLVACDEHGALTLFNSATRTFHGQDASPLLPEEWAGHYDLFGGDGVTPLSTEQVPLYRAWQGETLRDAEMVIRPSQGEARHLLASGGPMFAPDGQPLGAVVTLRDVTLRRAAEQQLAHSNAQLQHSNAELRAANEELEAFAYSASHDLKTPVRHVQSFSELARKALREASPEAAARHLGFVEQAATRMNTLIDAMLLLSRSTRQEMTLKPVHLQEVVERARTDLDADLKGGQVEWRVGPLPQVRGDPALLQQVMNNLLSNAVKFSRTKEQPVIEVWGEETPSGWTVFVRDNGVGFEEKYKERLFGVFQRLHTDREFEGTGVGLATVRRIILRHGGTVDASSAPGQGATFSFTLPRDDQGPSVKSGPSELGGLPPVGVQSLTPSG